MLRFWSGALAGLFVSVALAQNDAVVVTATRFAQPRSQTLQPVTVISAEDIAASGQQTLVEVLQSLGGVEIGSNGGFGQPASVFMRGANPGHTLVLVDGLRMSSATTGTTALENIPLSQIERIEVVPGQLSSLYGSEAIGGVIQVFTRAAADGPALNASAGIGTYDTRSFAAGTRRQLGDTSFALNAGYLESQGFDATKPNPANPFDIHNPDRDPYRNGNVSAKLAQRWSAGHEVGATLLRSEGTTHFDGGPTTDDVNQQTLSAYSLYSRDQITERWKSLVRVAEATDDSTVKGAFPGFFTTRQPQLTWQNDVRVGPGTVVAGLEYVTQHVASDTAYTKTYRDVRSAFAGYTGAYGRHSWQANVRQDDNSQFGPHTTGLLGYGYAVTTAWRVRASVASAFKAPTFNDLYFPGFSNPNLQPERARSRELGVNYQAGGQRFTATYFDNRISDLIVLDPTFTPQNLARARIKGTELAYELFTGGWHLRGQATFQDPKDEASAQMLPRRAREHATVALDRAAGAWKFGGEVVASSARFDQAGEDPATRMHGYTLLNLTASYLVSRAVSVRARWNNVFDRDYELVQNFNTPGSNVFVGVNYQMP